MPSFEPKFLENIRFSTNQLGKLKTLGEFKGRQFDYVRPKSDFDSQQKWDSYRTKERQISIVQSVKSSNAIEGIVATVDRIRSIVVDGQIPKTHSEEEIAGYAKALNFVHDNGPDMPMTTGVIRQLHQMVYAIATGRGGTWKSMDNTIAITYPDGTVKEVLFEPVPAFKTPDAMETLVQRFSMASQSALAEPLVLIPLFILDFLCVHPFLDGNGRVSRLLSLLLLYHQGFEVGRYVSLEKIVEDSKDRYYDALNRSDQKWHKSEHDPHPWLNYFWGMMLEACQQYESTLEKEKSESKNKSEKIRQLVLLNYATFTIPQVHDDHPEVSLELVRRVVRQLRDEGFVKALGRGRGAKWQRTKKQEML